MYAALFKDSVQSLELDFMNFPVSLVKLVIKIQNYYYN